MQNKTYQIPYSKSFLEFTLPSEMQATVAVSKQAEPIADVPAAIQDALGHPIGSLPLREIAKSGDRVCIVFTDITRASPDHQLVPALLHELELAGVQDENITLLCGIGMHRSSTVEEKNIKLGADIAARYKVIDNEPQNSDALVDLGITSGGVPVVLHCSVVESDLLIATGIVEPHQYAGYSGGRKTRTPKRNRTSASYSLFIMEVLGEMYRSMSEKKRRPHSKPVICRCSRSYVFQTSILRRKMGSISKIRGCS